MNTVCITDFGAASDGRDCTAAIQAAIDTCFAAGGGEVQVPAGTFVTATLRLRSNVTLHLLRDACLQGMRDAEAYTAWVADTVEPLDADRRAFDEAAAAHHPFLFNFVCSRWRNALIRAVHAKNIAIIGEENSLIDGADCYDAQGEEGFRGPHAIGLHDCDGVTLHGYTVRRSGNWAHAMFECRDIRVTDIRVFGGHDGVHVRSCDRVAVRGCVFHTGDDCVAGFDNTDVTVEDCELNTACSAFRFGGTHVSMRRCRLFGPAEYMHRLSLSDEEKRHGVTAPAAHHRRNMLSAFTYFADNSRPVRYSPGDWRVEECTVENADRLLHYNFSGNEAYQQNRPLQDIHFEDIRAGGIRLPLNLCGTPDQLVTCTLHHVDLAFAADMPLMHAAYFNTILLDDVTIHGTTTPRVRVWTMGTITGSTPVLTERADEAFFATPL